MIKLINYKNHKEGQIVFINKSCIGGMVRDEQEGLTRVWDNGVTECAYYDFKETPEEILAMPDIEVGNKVIDWEQRRYEIANNVIGRILSVPYFLSAAKDNTIESLVSVSVRIADALINELKKGGGK